MASEYAGYPLTDCPECGSSDLAQIVGACDPTRQFGLGERAYYHCDWCDVSWIAIVPEPPDGYGGDGVFAENH